MSCISATSLFLKARHSGILDGFRQSEQSWRGLLCDLKARGLKTAPKVALGDGALGFWKAPRKVFPETRAQRCRVHKTANVLNKLPESLQEKAKADLHEIWMADTRENANAALDTFLDKHGAKYPRAVGCLKKERDVLLTFYDFPAEHWIHLRTTNLAAPHDLRDFAERTFLRNRRIDSPTHA